MGSIVQDKRKNNSWYLNINGRNQIIKVYHLLYDNSSRFMYRKYNKFLQIL